MIKIAITALLVFAASSARADLFPYVVHGPVITGTTHDEAWVAWYTVHSQGKASSGNACQVNALTGTPNDTIPTLTLSPGALTPGAGGGVKTTFEAPDCSQFHRVHLTGLQADTTYTFSLDKTYADHTAVKGTFTTAPSPGAPKDFQFVVYGDTRGNSIFQPSGRPEHEAEVKAILAHDPGASFLVHTGDVALNMPFVSGADRGYAEFFDVERVLLAGRPLFTNFGNHESYDTAFFDGLMNAPSFAGAPHPYYFSIDWGQVHIAFLDAFEGKRNWLQGGSRDPLLTDAQAAWLDGDLAKAHASGKLLFLVSHQGAFSYGKDPLTTHGGHPDVQKKVIPLMIKYGVLGIFAGHDHYYERGHEACIDYLVVGSGGANMHDPDTSHAGVIAGLGSPAYLVVTVKQGVATGEAKDATGKVFDSFTFVPAACVPQASDGALLDAGGGDARTADGGAADGGVPDKGSWDQGVGEGPTLDVGGADGAFAQEDLRSRDGAVAAPGPSGGCDCRFDVPGEEDVALGGWLLLGLLGLFVRLGRRRRRGA